MKRDIRSISCVFNELKVSEFECWEFRQGGLWRVRVGEWEEEGKGHELLDLPHQFGVESMSLSGTVALPLPPFLGNKRTETNKTQNKET